ncbi:MAG: hypothetical protein WBQ64_06035 [Terriglobales bacterium]
MAEMVDTKRRGAEMPKTAKRIVLVVAAFIVVVFGITGVGWHTFRHSVGTMLAEMGEHQLTIRDYLRHSNLHVTNKYLQATSKTKRLAQDKLVDAILPTGILPKTNLIQ